MLQIFFITNSLMWQVGIKYGDSLLGINVIVTLAIGFLFLVKGRRFKAFSTVSLLTVFFVGLYSFPVVVIGPCRDEYFRAAVSGFIFALFFSTAFEIGRTASATDWSKLEGLSVVVLKFGIATILLEFVFPQLFPSSAGYRAIGKSSGIFSEPSALITSMSPSLIVLLNSKVKKRVHFGFFSLFIFFISTSSATAVGVFAVYIIYSFIYAWSWHTFSKMILGVLAISIAFVLFGYDEFVVPIFDRVAGLFLGENTSEGSSLVYAAGFQDAVGNFVRTVGLGTGFNTMGCDPMPYSVLRIYMSYAGLEGLNYRDGSFLLSKLVSEFGILGFAVIIIFWRQLRKVETVSISSAVPDQEVMKSVIKSFLLCFLTLAIIRSSGYFHGSVFLGILALGGSFRLVRQSIHIKLGNTHT